MYRLIGAKSGAANIGDIVGEPSLRFQVRGGAANIGSW